MRRLTDPLPSEMSINEPDLSALVDGTETALVRVVRAVTSQPWHFHPRQDIKVPRPHVFEHRSVEAIDWGHMYAAIAMQEAPDVTQEIVTRAMASGSARAAIAGSPEATEEAVQMYVLHHLELLADRYFEERPTGRGLSRRLVRLLAEEYGAPHSRNPSAGWALYGRWYSVKSYIRA